MSSLFLFYCSQKGYCIYRKLYNWTEQTEMLGNTSRRTTHLHTSIFKIRKEKITFYRLFDEFILLKAEISQSQSPHLASCRAGCCSPGPGLSGWLRVSSWALPLCRGRTAPPSSGMSCPERPRPAPAWSPAFRSRRPRQSCPPSSPLKYKM